jgi:Protein of unknown function (DUF3224)
MKTFAIRYRSQDWKETTLLERADGLKLTRVEAQFAYEGALDGTAKLGYIMQYFPDGTGAYDGWELFEGRFEGSPGTVLLRHEGTFDPQGVNANVTSVDQTGTGSLEQQRIGFQTRFEGNEVYELTLEVA